MEVCVIMFQSDPHGTVVVPQGTFLCTVNNHTDDVFNTGGDQGFLHRLIQTLRPQTLIWDNYKISPDKFS